HVDVLKKHQIRQAVAIDISGRKGNRCLIREGKKFAWVGRKGRGRPEAEWGGTGRQAAGTDDDTRVKAAQTRGHLNRYLIEPYITRRVCRTVHQSVFASYGYGWREHRYSDGIDRRPVARCHRWGEGAESGRVNDDGLARADRVCVRDHRK